jgi:hypothetical protein
MAMLDDLIAEEQVGQFPEQSLLGAIERQKRPADPLRWLRDKIPHNTGGGLSMLNMIREALGTSANWLDGTQDPSLIGPQEMVSPLGLGSMGTGMANAMTRPAARHVTGGELHRGRIAGHPRVWVDGPDGTTPASVGQLKRAGDFGSIPSRERVGFAQNDVFADNARSSAPGTVVNSLDMSEAARMQRAKEMGFDTERAYYHGTHEPFDAFRDPKSATDTMGPGAYLARTKEMADSYGSERGGVTMGPLVTRGKIATFSDEVPHQLNPDGTTKKTAPARLVMSMLNKNLIDLEHGLDIGKRDIALNGRPIWQPGMTAAEYTREFWKARGVDGIHAGSNLNDRIAETVVFDPRNIRSTQAAFDPARKDSANLLAASPSSSLPGLAANSTQLSEPMLMELIRRMNEGDT